MAGFDVAVVGAGIVGAAIAHACSGRGARVLLVERDEPGAHASGAAAGMLAPCSEAHGPGPFLDLARAGLAGWPGLAATVAEESGVDPELELCGLLRVALDEADATEVAGKLVWQRAAGIEAAWLDGPDAVAVEPALAGAAGAALYPDEGHVHSRRAVRALVEAARRRGAEVRCGTEVTAITPDGLLLAGGSMVAAGTAVIAAGAWAARLAQVPVRPVRGQLVAVRGLPRPPSRVLFAGLRGYALARRDGTVLVGATEEDAGFDARVTVAATRRLLERGRALLDGFDGATFTATWAGLRPKAPDGLPLLGPLPVPFAAPRVVAAAGHHRNGVLLAPVTAAGVADIALEGRTPEGWEAFDPRRFG